MTAYQRQLAGSVASLRENAARYDAAGLPVAAARCAALATRSQQRLDAQAKEAGRA